MFQTALDTTVQSSEQTPDHTENLQNSVEEGSAFIGMKKVGEMTAVAVGGDASTPEMEKLTKEVEKLNVSSTPAKEGKIEENNNEEDNDKSLPILAVSSLPLPVQNRVRALRKNQKEIIDIETEFYKELHELECKYEGMYQEKFNNRREFVTGEREPTEEEAEFPLGPGLEFPEMEGDEGGKKMNGIPSFWSTVLQSVDIISSIICEQDLPALVHLIDLRHENTTNPVGFKLYFHFSPNQFFENEVLVKSYILRNEPDPQNPLAYEGPEIISCQGTPIQWKPDKDLTKKVMEKRQKHKRTGTIRILKKIVDAESFFNFFNPPVVSPADEAQTENQKEDREEIVDKLNLDFEIGQCLRERIIPRAVLYFTGENEEDESDFSSEDEEDEDAYNEGSEAADVDEEGDAA